MSAPEILVIGGPTASGKTRLAVELALRYGGEVVSADSMQIYRGMDIGTAKPTAEEMRGVPHHMIDVADPAENYSVARYVAAASACVDDILARGKLPIVAGGTGLYIDSLLSGRPFAVLDAGCRAALQKRAEEEGIGPLLNELSQVDPETASRLHPHDEKRILRALEVYHATGKPISQHNRESKLIPPRYRAAAVLLAYSDRRDMWRQIDRRVDEMMERGLAEEVRSLLDAGVPESCTAMQAIGYKEMAARLRGDGDVQAAAEEIKLRSRQYAKRQLTWFRRWEGAHWYFWEKIPNFSSCILDSTEYLSECGL